jgi:hypothetical protein
VFNMNVALRGESSSGGSVSGSSSATNGCKLGGTSSKLKYGESSPAGTKRPVGAAADDGTMTFTVNAIAGAV